MGLSFEQPLEVTIFTALFWESRATLLRTALRMLQMLKKPCSYSCSSPCLAQCAVTQAMRGQARINNIDTVRVSAGQAASMSEHEAAKDLIFTLWTEI